MNKTKNIMMLAAAAAVLVALNAGVFVAAGNGTMSPINNQLLWGGFVVLNVASILWAVSMLGLQPLVVSLSYVAGGAIAFLGVRGMGEISAAEITTAGATYGAFGALAVGNATAKVRLAFFNKGQVPFIFIIVGLLVLDGVLNSQVSSAGVPVLLNAVLLPFVIAGVVVGVLWSLLNRFGIGKKPSEVLAARDAAQLEDAQSESAVEKKIVIPMPAKAAAAKTAPAKKAEPLAPAAKAKAAPKAKKAAPKTKPVAKTAAAPAAKPQPVAKAEPAPKPAAKPQPVAKAEPAPKPAAKPQPVAKAEPAPKPEAKPQPAAKAEPKTEKPFFPIELDNQTESAAAKPELEVPEFDAALYASGAKDANEGGVLVEEPRTAVETRSAQPAVEKKEAAAVTPAKEEAAKKKSEIDDLLGGHLALLDKLNR